MKAGALKRISAKLPNPNRKLLKKFRKYVRRFLRKRLRPLSSDVDLSFERWLEQTPYTASRKEELRRVWYKNPNIRDPKYHACKCFMKDETYGEYKHARGIFSRSDEWKCFMGPFIKAIENEVYKLPEFIKHVPVAERPDYIMEKLFRPDAKFFATDYTSFESSFIAELMDCCAFELYRYMMYQIPSYKEFLYCMKVISGNNKCYFKNFWLMIKATRMSGEMDTSLANGFTNLMVNSFLCQETGCGEPNMVVEGDDGLATTPSNRFPTSEDFAKLGFNIKIDEHVEIETASFCGIIFDRDEKIAVTDPLSTIFSTGWLPERYAKAKHSTKCAILRCKAFSAAYQYPGCPMIDSYAQYILRLTRQYHGAARDMVFNKNVFNNYEREEYQRAFNAEARMPHKTVGIATRLLVERKFGISIAGQIAFEEVCDGKTSLSPIDGSSLLQHVHPSWIHYYNMYGCSDGQTPDYPTMEVFEVPSYKRYLSKNVAFDSIDVDDPNLMAMLKC